MLTMPAVEKQLLTVDEYMKLPEHHVELIDGKVFETMPPLLEHGFIAGNIYAALREFVKKNELGRVFGEGSFLLKRDPDTVRAPDVCLLDTTALKKLISSSYYDGPPTLAVEVVSKNDSLRKTREKSDEFLEAGAEAVWIIYPKQLCVFVRTPDDPEIKYEIGQSIPGGDILPGFGLPVAEIFDF